jgi:murein DD-endopeptidase MepM/ murein hydrolase activator NlpD
MARGPDPGAGKAVIVGAPARPAVSSPVAGTTVGVWSRVLAVLLAASLTLGSAVQHGMAAPGNPAPAAPAAGRPVRYTPPVSGAVVRAFEPASTRFGAGHRGVDLDHPVGAPVGSAADGIVRHAGPVAGIVWVSVEHADGITTSYGPLAAPRVGRGDAVERGDLLGVLAPGGHGHDAADRGLHWGARRGTVYLDPWSLLEASRWRPTLVGPGGWRGIEHAVEPYTPWEGRRWRGLRVAPSPVADRPGFAVPPNPNHLVLVRGLGSSSDGLPFDPADLGYDPRSVTAHSYAGLGPGRRAAGGAAVGDPGDPWRAQLPYGPEDTYRGVAAASLHLRDQLRARWADEPGRAVDLVGYSMGGVVVLHYLTHHHDPYDPTLPPIGHVVTLASPLQGSDVAGLGAAIRDHRALGDAVGRLQGRGRLAGSPPVEAAALEDLRPGSELLQQVAQGWQAAVDAEEAGALAMGTRVLTVAGHRDRVVAAPRTPVPGDPVPSDLVHDGPAHVHRVLPGDHGSVLDTEALREVTWRFLAGQEVVESPGRLPVEVARRQSRTLRAGAGLLRLQDLLAPPWEVDR